MGIIVGFVGIESYDLIHYLSRIARALGQKSLMVDLSDNRALSHTIRNPLVPDGEIVDFRGVDFIARKIDVSKFSGYDYVFIDFGFQVNSTVIDVCDEVFCVTDFQRHNIARLREVQLGEQFIILVLKDEVSINVKADAVLAQLPELQIDSENVYTIAHSDSNYASALGIQYGSVFRFDRITSDYKTLLLDYFSEMFKESEVKAALKKASKGK